MLKHLKSAYQFLGLMKLIEIGDPMIQNDLLKYEQTEIIRRYKFGVLYAKAGQTEDEIFSNGNK
jgi:hypothetical protein